MSYFAPILRATRPGTLWFAGLLAACADSGPSPHPPAALIVTDSATGPVVPGPGYIHIALDAGAPQILWLDSSLTLADLSPGPVTVRADLLRPQCTTPATALPVTLAAADTVHVHFQISCQVIWGYLAIGLPTTGPNQPALLTVTIDGQAVGGASPNVVGFGVPFVTAGSRSIGLSGYGANCVLTEPNPQVVTVPLGDTLRVAFTLACA